MNYTNGSLHLRNKTTNRTARTSLVEQTSHLNKTLSKVIDRFEVAEFQKQRLLEKFSQTILENKEPSAPENEQLIIETIKQHLQETRGSEEAFRFSHLYNKLASRQRPNKKWSILYLLTLLKRPLPDRHSIASSRTSLSSHRQEPRHVPITRSHEQEDSPRNIRRRLSTPVETSKTLSVADQLAKARERQQRGVSVSEAELLRDLVYLFQGIDGQYIRFDAAQNDHVFAPGVNVSKPVEQIVSKLTETGWLYTKVRDFVQERNITGLVAQSLCAALQEELKDYYKFIAMLETQLEKQLANTDQVTDQSLTLKRLVVWTLETNQKLKLMGVLIDACQGQKGGALISVIHNYTKHGDPFIKNYLVRILEAVSTPFYEIMERWVYEGELDDPYEEFFVACDNTVSKNTLWQQKYTLRENMLPSFLSRDLALKIYSIGKSLNFIRYSCHEDTFLQQTNYASHDTFKYGDTGLVEKSIEVAYVETSKQLICLLQSKYKLMSHLKAVKRYLLLGQGDFVQYLIDHLWEGLGKPAGMLYRHNLTSILKTAVRSSNAQYDDPDILNRLDVQLLEVQKDDMGWDIFSLSYHVDAPINTVFNTTAMHNYLKIFHFLWRLKRVEYTLSSAWRQWGKSNHGFMNIHHIQQDIKKVQLTIQRMVHFIYQLQHYVLFEVLECSWDKLETRITQSADLDSIIEAHDNYLTEITEKGFLSGGKNAELAEQLTLIFECILNYKVLLDHLYHYASNQVSGRDQSHDKLNRIRRFHKDMESEFTAHVFKFLSALKKSNYDEDLRSLSTRLDYNNFYSRSQV